MMQLCTNPEDFAECRPSLVCDPLFIKWYRTWKLLQRWSRSSAGPTAGTFSPPPNDVNKKTRYTNRYQQTAVKNETARR